MAKTISLVILLTVFSFTSLPVIYSATTTLIHTTCKNTPFFDPCVSTLQADPRSSTAANVAELAHIAADSVNAKSIATLNQITGLLKSAKDPNLKKALQECVDKYNAIIKADIPTAIEAIDKGNPKFAVGSATDAANEAQICENGFANTVKSPITVSNKVVHDLSSVLSSIASLLL